VIIVVDKPENVRRDTGEPVRRISGSNFIPLIETSCRPSGARAMIHRYLETAGVVRYQPAVPSGVGGSRSDIELHRRELHCDRVAVR